MNGVVSYNQLIRHTVDHVCPNWWSAVCTNVSKTQALKPKFRRLETNAPR